MTEELKKRQHIEVILMGDAESGKTTMSWRFVGKEYVENPPKTIGCPPIVRENYEIEFDINGVKHKIKTKMIVLDTYGQERYKCVTRSDIKRAIGCMLVYNVTKKKSFENVKNWFDDMKKAHPEEDYPMILVGNEIDLPDKRMVSKEEGQHLADELKIPFFETSGKTMENIEIAFQTLGKIIMERKYTDFNPELIKISEDKS